MPVGPGDRRRVVLWAVLVAVALGLALAWWIGIRRRPTPETRAHEAAEHIQERVRELTR